MYQFNHIEKTVLCTTRQHENQFHSPKIRETQIKLTLSSTLIASSILSGSCLLENAQSMKVLHFTRAWKEISLNRLSLPRRQEVKAEKKNQFEARN
jgi:hypothetical protein